MKKEKSCGAVVVKKENNKYMVLLLKHLQGHISFPKGHMEKGETCQQTALREIKEETNLDVNFFTDFRKVITYSPSNQVVKDVVYYLAQPINDKVVVQEDEIETFMWVELRDGLEVVTYDNDKQVLQAVISYIYDYKEKKF